VCMCVLNVKTNAHPHTHTQAHISYIYTICAQIYRAK
jgi:hypothetical protein